MLRAAQALSLFLVVSGIVWGYMEVYKLGVSTFGGLALFLIGVLAFLVTLLEDCDDDWR